MNISEFQNIKMVFNTMYIGINRVADKDIRMSLVATDNDGLFDLYTFEVTGFRKATVKVVVSAFGALRSDFHALDLVTAALREGNFEDIQEVNELATVEQKEALEKIIAFANTKPQKFNVCRKCNGTGLFQRGHINGNCFNCGKEKKGHNPNKWLKIKLEAQRRLEHITKPLSDHDRRHYLNPHYDHLLPQYQASTDSAIAKLQQKAGL